MLFFNLIFTYISKEKPKQTEKKNISAHQKLIDLLVHDNFWPPSVSEIRTNKCHEKS